MASLCTQSSIEQRGCETSRVEEVEQVRRPALSCAQEFIVAVGRLNAMAQIAMATMMTSQTTNRNSRSLKYRPTSLSRCRNWMMTILSCGQNCGDATCRNCPRCGCRRHRNRHGDRRFLRHHASADYVRPVVAEFLAALCTAADLDISRRDSNRCGGNSGCRMSCFAAVQP